MTEFSHGAMLVSQTLSDDDVERMRVATAAILEQTGFRVEHDGLRRVAGKAGARVDDVTGIIRVPTPLLDELVAQAPTSYTVAQLHGTEIVVNGNEPFILAIVTDPWIIDFDTQRPRRPRLEDVRRHTIVGQQLPMVGGMSRMDFPVADIDGATSSLRALETHLLHHDKHHLVLPTSAASWHQWLDIYGMLCQARTTGSAPLCTLGFGVKSPLTLNRVNGELLLEACKHGFPAYPTICPMAGSTAPFSHASLLLLGNAENIFLAWLTQAIQPGHPFIYSMGPSVTDLRTGHDIYYSIDKVLWKLPSVQMARAYGLPAHTECGGTLSYRHDIQAGAEGMLFMLAALASRAASLGGIGSCCNAVGMSAEMMVIQAAWHGAAKFLLRGFHSDDLRLAAKNIMRAGPGGHFLTDDLTLELMRGDEFFSNDLFDRFVASAAGPGMLERAHAQVEELVADFVSPIPDRLHENLQRYFHDLCATMTM